MMNRRKFIRGTAAGAVALQPTLSVLASSDPAAGVPAIVVHDLRCADPREPLAALGVDAAQVHRIVGDTTAVWTEHLKSVWAQRQALTAGVTWDAEFFVLKTLARDQGYKVVYEQRDPEDKTGAVTWVLAPA